MEIDYLNNLFSTAYLPTVEYFYHLNKYQIIYIDIFENYIKQTYRNRCYINAANGKLLLSIPVIKTSGNHTKVKDIEIDHSQPWQKIHWRSIESAYNSSPFFLYFRDEIEPFYIKKYKFLIDLNTELLHTLLKLCEISTEIKFTETYIESNKVFPDFRHSISPKNNNCTISSFLKYTQVFSNKYDFIPNLSILDLLFNEGKMTVEYLKSMKLLCRNE